MEEQNLKNNIHSHISHDEIEKYVSANEEIFLKEDLIFFEEFDNRLDNCQVCAKRFRMYTLIQSMIGPEEINYP